jgi:hypothetical protein
MCTLIEVPLRGSQIVTSFRSCGLPVVAKQPAHLSARVGTKPGCKSVRHRHTTEANLCLLGCCGYSLIKYEDDEVQAMVEGDICSLRGGGPPALQRAAGPLAVG